MVKVLGMLERGELIDSPEHHPVETDFGFYIGCQYKEHPCGTLACIGGWVAILNRWNATDNVNKYMPMGSPLRKLYWGYPCGVKVEHAAIGLRNFLTFGDPKWDEALGR